MYRYRYSNSNTGKKKNLVKIRCIFKAIKEEMKVTVHNTALNQMILGISIRFSQETINIKSVANFTNNKFGGEGPGI